MLRRSSSPAVARRRGGAQHPHDRPAASRRRGLLPGWPSAGPDGRQSGGRGGRSAL